jgi:excisionase family DNA binding protein
MSEDAQNLINLIRKIVQEEIAHLPPPAPVELAPYVTVKQASKLTSVPEQTIRKWLSQKRLKTYRVGGCVRVKVSELIHEE